MDTKYVVLYTEADSIILYWLCCRIVQFFKPIVVFLLELNLFVEPETIEKNDVQIQRKQVLSTRLYLVLMAISLTIIVLLTMLPQNETKITILNPSIATYDRLESDYLDTLSCSCKNIAIPLKLFLSIQPRFHEVSEFFFEFLRINLENELIILKFAAPITLLNEGSVLECFSHVSNEFFTRIMNISFNLTCWNIQCRCSIGCSAFISFLY